MENYLDTATREILAEFAENVVSWFLHELSAGTLVPENEQAHFFDYENFLYTDKGVQTGNFIQRTIIQKNWMAIRIRLYEIMPSIQGFGQTEQYIAEHYPQESQQHPIRDFCNTMVQQMLATDRSLTDAEIQSLISRLIRDLNQETFTATAVVQLAGIILQSEEVRLDEHALIRQTQRSDLEVPRLVGGMDNIFFSTIFNAVLEIRHQSKVRFAGFPKEKINYYIAMLKLCGIGSVKIYTYSISSDLLISNAVHGTFMSNDSLPPWTSYLIKRHDEAKLTSFFSNFTLPKNFASTAPVADYLSTSFERYSEALIDHQTLEKKIATVIMGVEALLSNDSIELSFKMSVRAGRLLGVLGFSALLVKETMSKAYSVRSKYAHGGFLSVAEKQKLTNAFCSTDSFVKTGANYLRVLIIIFSSTGLSKNDLITLIDNSLIDEESLEKLKNATAQVKQHIFMF
jgi:hypothetical protein